MKIHVYSSLYVRGIGKERKGKKQVGMHIFFVLFCFGLKRGLAMYFRLTLNSLHSPGSPGIDLPASASWIMGRELYAIVEKEKN